MLVHTEMLAQYRVAFEPSMQITAVHDDNLFYSAETPARDVIQRFSPELVMQVSSPFWSVVGSYSFDGDRFASHSDFSSRLARQRALIKADYRPTPRLTLAVNSTYIDTNTPAEFNVETGLASARLRTEQVAFRPSANYRITDRHPEVIQAKAQPSDLEAQRARDGSAQPNPKITKPDRGTNAELAALQREEQTLRSEIAAYEQKIHLAPQYEQNLEKLENDYKTAKETYDSLRTRYEEAQLAESLEQTRKGESFHILDTAVVPTLPAAPNRIRLHFMALLLAVISAIGIIMLMEHLDTSFHSVGELRQFTTVTVLATIPYIQIQTKFASKALRVALFAGAVIACVQCSP